MAKIAFIGLGVMGFPMAGHLARQGHHVTVFNRTQSRAIAWADLYGGQCASTPAAAAATADFTFTCLGNDSDLEDVLLGEGGVFASMRAGTVMIDHTTASAKAARHLNAKARDSGLLFLDAPVSGGQSGAENGKLTIMVGGELEAYVRAVPIMSAYALATQHMGPSGAGQLTKMVNQICIAGLIQALAEGISFAENAGLDGAQVIATIAKGAAQSWQMDNRALTMLSKKFDFGFAVDLMRKDLGICLDEGERNGSRLPITSIVDGFYAELQQLGHGRLDTSSLALLTSPVRAKVPVDRDGRH